MKTPLAWLNLTHHKGRSLGAAGGAAVAVALIFLQLGFHAAADPGAAAVHDELNFDILLVSANYVDFSRPGSVPRGALSVPLGLPGVRKVMPLNVGFAAWRDGPGSRRRVLVIGFDLDEPVFRRGRRNVPAAVAQHRAELRQPDRVLVDRLSGRDFGNLRRGAAADLGARRVTVAGPFALGVGEDAALCGDTDLSRILGGAPADRATMALVLLERGASAGRVAAELRKVLPADVQALTRRDVAGRERHRRAGTAATGALFTLGVVVAFGLGVVVLYHGLATDVYRRRHEFATLAALGYSTPSLCGVVLRQALLLAAAGYAAGLVAALALYALARGATGSPIGMSMQRGLAVLALAAVMGGLAGSLASRHVRVAEPADWL